MAFNLKKSLMKEYRVEILMICAGVLFAAFMFYIGYHFQISIIKEASQETMCTMMKPEFLKEGACK